VRELLVTEQSSCREAVATWVVEGGRAVSGREDDRRLAELRRGLARHPGVRLQAATTRDETVERTLLALHDASYLEALDRVRSDDPVVIPELTAPGLEPDVPVCASLVKAARGGVKTAIASAEHLASGAQLTYALSRPPGHHAGPAWFGGYCYLNTAAAAAVTLLDRGIATVGILDLDLHYPNGTSAIVESLDGVRLHSLHSSTLPDATAKRAAARAGVESQIVFDRAPSASEYLTALSRSIDLLARSTDALVLSLGYDILRNDPHGSWSFSPAIFVQIGRLIASSRLPVCVVQEGGYSLGRLAACSYAFATGLLGWGAERRSNGLDGSLARRPRLRQRRGAHGRHVA
jgi:acetoin utilization deacetylase AcuC-like enzyme